MKIEVKENSMIFPLFTEKLRTHLNKALFKEKQESEIRMKEDGWGKTKFGDPNPKFYGNNTHYFYSHFLYTVLDQQLNLIDKVRPNGKAFMRAGEIKNGKFKLLPYPNIMSEGCFKYFKDFEFDVEDINKDFYLMGRG